MIARQPQTIRRMISQLDEALPTGLFYEIGKVQAEETPLEIEENGTRYAFTDCFNVPSLNGSMLYTIGVYTEIMEAQP